MVDVTAEPLDVLRQRSSVKWRTHPDDVLPLFVAEMDYPLAAPVIETLLAQVSASDIGYAGGPGTLPEAFAGFAERRWGWNIDPVGVRTTTDVSVAIVESLRQVISPGDGVVITPPVYPPFFDLPPEAGGVVVKVPLVDHGGWQLDLDALEIAFRAGARAMLLCNPHNPLGLVHSHGSLTALAELAARYGVAVVSDEIHAPLTHSGAEFTPFLSVSDAAAQHGICVTSASKAFNLAGAKCAIMLGSSEHAIQLLDAMPYEVGYRTSILGLHASSAAFAEGYDWLLGTIHAIEESRDLLASLLAERLPEVVLTPPAAGYLAWLDARMLGWGDDPSIHALEHARVALNPGPSFGAGGDGHLRLNFACSPEVLTEAITRLAAAH